MTRRRWVAAAIGLVLVAIVAVVWVIPAVSGPAVECIDIDPVGTWVAFILVIPIAFILSAVFDR